MYFVMTRRGMEDGLHFIVDDANIILLLNCLAINVYFDHRGDQEENNEEQDVEEENKMMRKKKLLK